MLTLKSLKFLRLPRLTTTSELLQGNNVLIVPKVGRNLGRLEVYRWLQVKASRSIIDFVIESLASHMNLYRGAHRAPRRLKL